MMNRTAVARVGAAAMVALALAGSTSPRAMASGQAPGSAGEHLAPGPSSARTTAELMAGAAIEAADLGEAPLAPDPWSSLTVSGSFTALALIDTSTVPPDGSIAAGPSQIIVIANGRIRSFTKSTGVADGLLNSSTNLFFSTARGSSTVTYGGRVRYDHLSGRWFITMAADSSPSRVMIASSNSATITTSTVWTFSSFDNTFTNGTCSTDGPTLGVDSAALYIGANQFCPAYTGTSAFVVRKSSALAGATLFVTAFHNLTTTPGGTGPFAPQGANNPDGTATVGYFLGVDNAAFGSLVLRRVLTPGAVPTLSANIPIAVAATALPISVRHQGNTGGTNGQLDGGDDRLASVTLRNGHLWAAQAIGVTSDGTASASPTRNGVRWYDISGIDGTPAVSQSGTVNASTGGASLDERSYWNPSIGVTGQGRSIIGFSAAGTSEFVNAGVAERLASDAAGTFGLPVLYTAATAAYNPVNDPGSARGRRWGGYSETVADGCDDTTVWTAQEFTDAANSYGLQVARLGVAAPPAPVTVTPNALATGLSTVTVSVTAAGNGVFFDPGPGFACHLAATIPGVTVTTVTQTGPTSLVLTLSTVNAVPGAKAITVANPDGQSATSGAILTIQAGAAMSIETPTAGAAGQPLLVSGWAIDSAALSGSGVDGVDIYANPAAGAAVFLGSATYGGARPDIAQLYGARFSASGFSLRTSTILPAGAYTISANAHSTATGTFNNMQTVAVTVAAPAPPFGSLDTPADNIAASGELGVTGWALDAAAIKEVDIYRDPVAGEPTGLVFIGKADIVRGARPDVQAAFPTFPNNDAAGWGFMILTNMFPNGGNGAFKLSVIAVNYAGLTTLLGTRHVTGANAASLLPFGTIDTPSQGQTVSGTLVNFGWALTPAASGIPVDGSTINVYVDGIAVGHPVYNQFRSDIATLFPGRFNSNGAVGYYMIDTTLLTNGLHSISWSVRDNAGQLNGIGSRYFRVQNGS